MTHHRSLNSFNAREQLKTPHGHVFYYRLNALEERGMATMSRWPFSMKVLLESLLRNEDGHVIRRDDIETLCRYNPAKPEAVEIPFMPARVILQDFTGVPAVVDLAAMRSAIKRLGGDPEQINPHIPVDLVIDHSVQVDVYGTPDSLKKNVAIEFERNLERYQFLRWGQAAFRNFRVVPPANGIVHQVNLEYLATCVAERDIQGVCELFPDSLVGTDSHTTMINGLGIVGWGVGGIEAEAVMLGQPIYMLTPEVVGMKLVGNLPEGATATDLTLMITQILRKHGVVEKFVEFYGPGLSSLTLPDRATIANMAPEYGATIGFFPIDDEALRYLRRTGRTEAQVDLVRAYYQAQGMFRTDQTPDPHFSTTLELDLSTVEPCLAGPKRPQDRVVLSKMKESWTRAMRAPVAERGFALSDDQVQRRVALNNTTLAHGSVVIAAITSCTNTSNPSVMLGAGLLARNAVRRGLRVPSYVKTSLAPGSKMVTEYLMRTGLQSDLERLGFYTIGYGCTTCIGNSGPLDESVVKAITEGNLVVASVLSGNRNFEGRVHANVRANYLASPPLVVAYAIAGTVDIDLVNDPLGYDEKGTPVYLRDVWPNRSELASMLDIAGDPELFQKSYRDVEHSNEMWNQIPVEKSAIYPWDEASTYIQEPPFFIDLKPNSTPIAPIHEAYVLVNVGDSVTTDHISPAGSIPEDSPAGRYLKEHGVSKKEFNSFGARRGNDRVMTRGTFGNIQLKNLLVPGKEGCWTVHLPTGEGLSIYDAAMRYQAEKLPTIVLAGVDYGMGSSRDWAAKGTFLLGVRAVIARSFERIHRSNLVGMGVLPLQFKAGESASSLGLTGKECFTIHVDDALKPKQLVKVDALSPETKQSKTFFVECRIDTPIEIEYYRNGGILQTVLRQMIDR